jgi:hypothetical protein
MSTKSAKVEAFRTLLNQPHYASDVNESLAKLRKMILFEGIPAKEASPLISPSLERPFLTGSRRTRLFAHGYGKFCFRSQTSLQRRSCNTWLAVPVMSERRSGMTRLGRWQRTGDSRSVSKRTCWSAFWTHLYGGIMVSPIHGSTLAQNLRYGWPDRQQRHQLGFTYVQGMNVLAAPFLYIMPSEMEAFFCFAKFIEVCCPLYVQPTLEGVHRGLKVRSRITA